MTSFDRSHRPHIRAPVETSRYIILDTFIILKAKAVFFDAIHTICVFLKFFFLIYIKIYMLFYIYICLCFLIIIWLKSCILFFILLVLISCVMCFINNIMIMYVKKLNFL